MGEDLALRSFAIRVRCVEGLMGSLDAGVDLAKDLLNQSKAHGCFCQDVVQLPVDGAQRGWTDVSPAFGGDDAHARAAVFCY